MADHHTRIQERLADIVEATKLSGAGRFHEASDLIQRRVLGHQDATPAHRAETDPEAARPASASHGFFPEGLQERLRDAIDHVASQFGLGSHAGLAPAGPATLDPAPLLRDGNANANAAGPVREGSFEERSFANEAGSRDYKLFVPSRTVAEPPLVIMLHGCGQSPDDFAAGTAMNRIAEAKGFLVAYPAQSSRAHGQRCWNWYQPGDQGRGTGEAEIIAGLTRAVMEEHSVDPRRVYIAGLSAGGAAAANIALAYPDLYAAVGVHSGLAAGCAGDVSSALTTMRLGPSVLPSDFEGHTPRVPTIMVHGESDTTVHPRNGEHVLVQAGIDALNPSVSDGTSAGGLSYTRTRYADETDRVVVESWVVRGLGHAWSGGDAAGSYTDQRGPDASQAMYEFFTAHRLDRPRQ